MTNAAEGVGFEKSRAQFIEDKGCLLFMFLVQEVCVFTPYINISLKSVYLYANVFICNFQSSHFHSMHYFLQTYRLSTCQQVVTPYIHIPLLYTHSWISITDMHLFPLCFLSFCDDSRVICVNCTYARQCTQ